MAKVMVIDDSEVMRRYLRKALGDVHEVEEWMPPSAMEIAGHIEESAPDLIITDYQMPGCSGATVARMVLKAKPGLPVIVVTAIRDDEVAATLRKFQVVDILYKPVSREVILAAVAKAIKPPAEA
jgi:DNA-binding NtrC family response regulator